MESLSAEALVDLDPINIAKRIKFVNDLSPPSVVVRKGDHDLEAIPREAAQCLERRPDLVTRSSELGCDGMLAEEDDWAVQF